MIAGTYEPNFHQTYFPPPSANLTRVQTAPQFQDYSPLAQPNYTHAPMRVQSSPQIYNHTTTSSHRIHGLQHGGWNDHAANLVWSHGPIQRHGAFTAQIPRSMPSMQMSGGMSEQIVFEDPVEYTTDHVSLNNNVPVSSGGMAGLPSTAPNHKNQTALQDSQTTAQGPESINHQAPNSFSIEDMFPHTMIMRNQLDHGFMALQPQDDVFYSSQSSNETSNAVGPKSEGDMQPSQKTDDTEIESPCGVTTNMQEDYTWAHSGMDFNPFGDGVDDSALFGGHLPSVQDVY